MKYFKLDYVQRKELMASLAGTKNILIDNFGLLTLEEARIPGPGGSFSPVEQVWHLADLEREGFGVRIRRLHSEPHPYLPDFDGDKIAQERNYRALSLADALKSFAEARERNLSYFSMLSSDEWSRSGTQEGIGEVSLCDMPVFINQHDQSHVDEILAWKRFMARQDHA